MNFANDNKCRFPFLIGTVRTYSLSHINHLQKKFPFLIGTVRTRSFLLYDEYRIIRVSIPHRYGKNQGYHVRHQRD